MDDERNILDELTERPESGAPLNFLHYLYFPTKRVAKSAAAELRGHGFRTETRLGADGKAWLVLARQEIVPNEENVSATRELLESLASKGGGEYDGWEVTAG